jgi:hypothetical protein
MKVDLLKKLIKEAVREVLKEELAGTLAEAPVRQVSKVTKFEPYKPTVSNYKAPVTTGDPIADLLQETRAQMRNQDNSHMQDFSQMVQAPGLGMQSHDSYQEPGLDISQFDFIKKAASVYNASVEKDKARFGQ